METKYQKEIPARPTTRDSLARFRSTWREHGLAAALREDWNITTQPYKTILPSYVGYAVAPVTAHAFAVASPNLDNLCDTTMVYGFARICGIRPATAAIGSAAVGIGTELLQKTGLLSGTYDPKDIAYFAAGSGLAYSLDKLVHTATVQNEWKKLKGSFKKEKNKETCPKKYSY